MGGVTVLATFLFIFGCIIAPWIMATQNGRKPLLYISVPVGGIFYLLFMVLTWSNPFKGMCLPGIGLGFVAELIVAKITEYNSPLGQSYRRWKKKEKEEARKVKAYKELFPTASVSVALQNLDDIGYGFLRFRPDEVSIFEWTEERKLFDYKEKINNEDDLLLMVKSFYQNFTDSGFEYDYEHNLVVRTQLINKVLHDDRGPYCLILGYGQGEGAFNSAKVQREWPDWFTHYAKDIDNYAGIEITTSSYVAPQETDDEEETEKEVKYAYSFPDANIVLVYDDDYIYEGTKPTPNRILFKIRSEKTTVHAGGYDLSAMKYFIYDATGLHQLYCAVPYFDADGKLFYLIDKGVYITNDPLFKAVVENDRINVFEGTITFEKYLKYVVRKYDSVYSGLHAVYRMK